MRNKNMRKIAAFALSGSMLIAGVAVGNYESAIAAEARSAATLSIAGQEDAEAETEELLSVAEDTTEAEEETEAATEKATEKEAETEKATETEKAVEYEKLETTKTAENAVSAIDVSGVVESVMPSIVSISMKSVTEVEDYFYGSQEIESEGAGSGVIISQNGTELLIATNNHVVKDAKDITVCFSVEAEDADKLIVPAVVKGTNSKYDLAVVAVNLADIDADVYKQLKIATLGSSDDLKVGQASIVIGNALGIGQTVTTGIISALEREITTEEGTFTEFQTDAAVNLGCSGGGIFNANGEVIGITSAKATEDYAESMGYGIPIDTAIPVLQELIVRETRSQVDEHGYLGITVVPVSEEAMQMYNMPAGAYVYEVGEGSGAEAAGIEKGDIITKFDGVDVTTSDELVKMLSYYEAGETVTVEAQVPDGGSYKTETFEVTLQKGAVDTQEKQDADTEDKDEQKNDLQNEDQQNEDQQNDGQQSDPYSSQGQGNWYGSDPFGLGGEDGLGGLGEFFFGPGYGNYGYGNQNGNGRY